jgi:hypothetical protein
VNGKIAVVAKGLRQPLTRAGAGAGAWMGLGDFRSKSTNKANDNNAVIIKLTLDCSLIYNIRFNNLKC